MSERRAAAAVCAALVALTALCFHGVLANDFVDYDDPDYITRNPIVNEGVSAAGLRAAFTRYQSNNWHPVTWISHMLDVSIFGLAPAGHHAVNALLHAANACLLFLVLRSATGALGPSAWVAAIFAVHPAHVESVAWASQRKDTLSALFWLLTMAAWVRYARRPGAGRYGAVCASLALGLMAKPMLVTLPFVLLLLDYWPLRRRLRGRLLLEKLPLLVLAAATAVATVLVQRSSGALKTAALYGWDERLANAVVSPVRYLDMLVWPRGLAVFYPALGVEGPSAMQVLSCGFLLLVITGAVLRWGRAHPYLPVGWLWYLGTLVPVIGLVQVGDQSHADRYTYIPSIGVLVALAWGVRAAWPVTRSRVLAGAGVVTVLACIPLTLQQVATWRDGVSLWTRAVSVTPPNPTAFFHLGSELGRAGRHEEAVVWLRRAVALLPDGAILRHNLANELVQLGRWEEARPHFERALRLSPGLAEARLGLAQVALRQREFGRAARLYAEALDARPELFAQPAVQRGYAEALYGDARSSEGSLDAAVASHRAALRRRPDWTLVANNLAWLLATHPRAQQRHAAEAVALVEGAARELGDGAPPLLDTLAAAYAAAGRFDEAVATALRARAAAAAQGGDALPGIDARIALYRAGRPYRDGEGDGEDPGDEGSAGASR